MFDQQTLKTISQIESFQCPDKQWRSEEGRRIQQPKRCITTNKIKDKDNSPKNYTQNFAHQVSSQKIQTERKHFCYFKTFPVVT